MTNKEGLYPSVVNRTQDPSRILEVSEHLPPRERNRHFAMHCNGYFLRDDIGWKFDSQAMKPFESEFKGQKVAFFGPGGKGPFFGEHQVAPQIFQYAFEQDAVTELIGKHRESDEDQAARTAYLLGGLIRHLALQTTGTREDLNEIAGAVKFAARMTALGERKSADAITSAMGMYIISKGATTEDSNFTGHIYHMADAIRTDPIQPLVTKDLGLSQVARLRGFMDRISGEDPQELPDISQQEPFLNGFPTVGAEFHFSLNAPNEYPNFWKRLALLNMSQYQRGSYIQFSRNDRDVIEVRMNPANFPVAIADWNNMKLFLPELTTAFFTATFNRRVDNFSWNNKDDKPLLNKLRTLGMLTYAGIFEDIPRSDKREEIDFGSVYLGQTVKLKDGSYDFSGHWSRGEGTEGQLGIYAGYGDNFPQLAYYVSMALTNPGILPDENVFQSTRTLTDAFNVHDGYRKRLFNGIAENIKRNERLRRATDAGREIVELLNP